MAREPHPVFQRGKWRIRWFDEHGRRCSEVYANENDAAFKLRQHLVAVEEVRRGLRAPSPVEQAQLPPERTFDDLVALWLAKKTAHKRSPKDDRSILRAHLIPAFGGLPLSAVTKAKIDAYHDAKAHLSPQTRRHHINLLAAMLRLAIEHDEDTPWLRQLPKMPAVTVERDPDDFDYLATDGEFQGLLAAARVEGPMAFTLYALALYTGMRAGELLGLNWDDVALDQRLIIVRRSFHKPTKTRRIRPVPIIDPLLPVLRAWRLQCPHGLLFPTRAGTMRHPSDRLTQEVFHRCLRRAGLPKLRFHDLRHSFASRWVMSGGDLYRLQKILGHSEIAMTERYSHLDSEVFRQDYARFGAPVAPEGARVVNLLAANEDESPCKSVALLALDEVR